MTEKQRPALGEAAHCDCNKPLGYLLRFGWGFHLSLFDFFGLVHQLVSLLQQGGSLVGCGRLVRFAAEEEVEL